MSRWTALRRLFGRDDAPAAAAPTAPAAEPGGGWRSAAPMRGVLQRDSGEVIRPERFRASVASFRDHGVLGGGLGHRLSGDAPSGVMRGLARADGRPVQRSDDAEFTWVQPESESTSDSGAAVPRSRRAVQRRSSGRDAARGAMSGGGAGRGSGSAGSPAASGGSASPPAGGGSGSTGSSGSGSSGNAGSPGTAATFSAPSSSGATSSSPPPSGTSSTGTASSGTASADATSAGAGPSAASVSATPAGGGSPGSGAVQRVALRRLAPPLTRARPITRFTPRRLPATTAHAADPVQPATSTGAEEPGSEVDLVVQRHADSGAPPARSDVSRPTAPSTPGPPADSGTAPGTAVTGDSTTGAGSTASGEPQATRPTLGPDRGAGQSGLGGPVQRMPSGAVPLHHDATGSPEPPPPVQRAAEPVPEQRPERPSPATRGRKRPNTTHTEVQRSTPSSRGGLGEPLERLPETATPLRPGGTLPAPGQGEPGGAVGPGSAVGPGGAAETAPLLGDAPQVQRTTSSQREPQATTPDDPAPADPVATPLAGASAEPAGSQQESSLPAISRSASSRQENTQPASTGPTTPVQRSRTPDAAGDAPHSSTGRSTAEGTAPLLGDTTIQRSRPAGGTAESTPEHSPSADLPTAQRNPAVPSATGTQEPSGTTARRSPGPAAQQPSGAARGPSTAPHHAVTPARPSTTAPHGTTPVQRRTAPSSAAAPETPPTANTPADQHEVSTGSHPVQRARPDSSTAPDEPDLVPRLHHGPAHPAAPVQRARSLLTARPLTTRTRLDQPRPNATAPPAEHRAAAPLRWTRREPGDRPAEPAPVQRSDISATVPAAAAAPPPIPMESTVDEPGTPPPVRTVRPVQRNTAPETPPPAREAPKQDQPTPPVPGVPPGVPVTVVPKQHEESTDSDPDSDESTGTGGGQDVEELARRLVEPVGRLLRTELRHGRERFGRTYDRRR